MKHPELHKAISSETIRIIESQATIKETYGHELIDLPPDELILCSTKLPLAEGTVEVALTTEAARPTFEWIAEITVIEPDNVEHYLLRPGDDIVETYGKNVVEVDAGRAQSLLDRLKQV